MDSKKKIFFNYVAGTAVLYLDDKEIKQEMTEDQAVELAGMINRYQAGLIPFSEIQEALDLEVKMAKDGWELIDDQLYHEDVVDKHGNPVAVPYSLAGFVKKLAREEQNTLSLVNFWKRCAANSDKNAVNGLFTFIRHNELTITPEGLVRGKKKVTLKEGEEVPEVFSKERLYLDKDLTVKSALGNKVGPQLASDFHLWLDKVKLVATHDQKTPYKIGEPTVVNRADVNPDPNISCGYGLHIGGDRYVNSFGGTVVISCLFDPADVVAVPTGEEANKLRVAKLLPIGIDEVTPLGKTVLPSNNVSFASNEDIMDWYHKNYISQGEDPACCSGEDEDYWDDWYDEEDDY